MGYIAVSYQFSNSTLADATQVNANFQNIIDGLSDATKNLNISALTAGGAASLGAAVTLGTTSVNDITINGSLASSIAIKTTYSYDIGSATIGLKSIYLGSSDSAARSTRVIGATVASSWTLTLPTGAGSASDILLNQGSGVSSWMPLDETINLGLTASVAGNALTIAVKTAAGADATSTTPIYISFRNSTATTGTPVRRSITGALSITVPSSATLGHTSAIDSYVWVYAIDNSGTVELAVSGGKVFEDKSLTTTTTIGAGSTSGTVIYSTTGRTTPPIRIIGRFLVNEATAGTWASAPTQVVLNPVPKFNCTDWESFTPTYTNFGTVSNNSGMMRRVGDTMEVICTTTLGTTVGTAATMTVPSSLSLSFTKLPTTGYSYFGLMGVYPRGAGALSYLGNYTAFVGTDGSSATSLFFLSDTGTATPTKMLGNTFASGQILTLKATFPIAGWWAYGP